jgi:hypothetical protein
MSDKQLTAVQTVNLVSAITEAVYSNLPGSTKYIIIQSEELKQQIIDLAYNVEKHVEMELEFINKQFPTKENTP